METHVSLYSSEISAADDKSLYNPWLSNGRSLCVVVLPLPLLGEIEGCGHCFLWGQRLFPHQVGGLWRGRWMSCDLLARWPHVFYAHPDLFVRICVKWLKKWWEGVNEGLGSGGIQVVYVVGLYRNKTWGLNLAYDMLVFSLLSNFSCAYPDTWQSTYSNLILSKKSGGFPLKIPWLYSVRLDCTDMHLFAI